MTLTFSSEGIARLSFLGGRARSMRWSIGRDGHLYAEVDGKSSVVVARLDGRQLTLAIDGRQATFVKQGRISLSAFPSAPTKKVRGN